MCLPGHTDSEAVAQPPTGIDISLPQLSNLENERKELLEERMACSKDEWCSVFCTESARECVCVCVYIYMYLYLLLAQTRSAGSRCAITLVLL